MWQPAAQTTTEPAETAMTPAACIAYATALAIAAAIPGPGIAALRNPKALRFLNRGAAVAMAGAAGWIIARA
jgi:threonine/homoserine/homoserine lactone efflux protein